mgnify:CR=1 FL=1
MALKVKKLESTPKKSSVTDNLYNTNSNNLLINDDIKTAKEKLMLDYDRIPLNKIKGRDDNRFELVNIESLAKSIDTVRLAQPVLLRRIDNSYSIQADGETEVISNISYEIVSGHRRVAAYELLYERNKVLQNRDNIEKYSKIPALILPAGATKAEIDALYEMTNFETRNLTSTDILRHVDYYLSEIQAHDIEEKLKDSSYRGTNKANFIADKFKTINVKINKSQVNRYIFVYENSCEELIDIFQKSYISLNATYSIAKKFKIKEPELLEKQKEFVADILKEQNDERNSVAQKEDEKRKIIAEYLSQSNDDKPVKEAIQRTKEQEKNKKNEDAKSIEFNNLMSGLSSMKKKIERINGASSISHQRKVITEDGLTRLTIDTETPLSDDEKDTIRSSYEILKDAFDTLEDWMSDLLDS